MVCIARFQNSQKTPANNSRLSKFWYSGGTGREVCPMLQDPYARWSVVQELASGVTQNGDTSPALRKGEVGREPIIVFDSLDFILKRD